MPAQLIATKIYFPPARLNLVPRPRLIERLEAGLRGPLTLIAAPAGYGKTTLMSAWRASAGAQRPVAWLSLDAGDDALYTFLAYMAAALDTLQAGLTANARLLLQSDQPFPPSTILTTLINDLAAYPSDCVLVLDDYHVISDPEIHAALEFLVRNQPPQMHLVILSRFDPALPLARLRARGQMVELRAEHLRFSPEETGQFLIDRMGLDLTPAQAAALEARSEGWIAGLQLAALAMQGPGKESLASFIDDFTGSHRYIMDYLVGDVLVNQPAAQREFLLKTSILERLSAWLCDAVTDRQDSQAILDSIEQSNLFLIPLDDERGWYRYHHLFGDVLRNRLRAEMPDQVRDLHRRAAGCLAQNGLVFEAIDHAFALSDFDFVRDLFRQYFSTISLTENRAQVTRFFERFPRAYLQNEPWLCVGYAWITWGEGKMQVTEELLACAEKAYQHLASLGKLPLDDLEYAGLPAEMLAFQALIHTQKANPDRVIELAEQAMAAAPEGTPVIAAIALLGQQVAYRQKGQMDKAIESCARAIPLSRAVQDVGTRVSVLHSLGVGLMIQGKLSQLVWAYEEGLRFAETRGESENPRYDLIYFKLADIAYIRNDLEQMGQWLRKGFACSERNTSLWPRFYGKILQVQRMLAQGDRAGAQNLQDEVETLLKRVRGTYFETELVGYVMMIRVLNGNLEGVQAWAQSCQQLLASPLNFIQLETAIQLAYIWGALGEVDLAIRLAEQIEALAARTGSRHLQLHALLPQIVGWVQKGNPQKAQSCLLQALILGEPEGYFRVFVDRGKVMRDLLVAADRKQQFEFMAAYIHRLLESFDTRPDSAPPGAQSQALIAPLSERELEVLGLIAAGHSNKEIAQALVIAIGTVKRHTVNIFNKLDVKNRTEAVARARQLGLR